MRTTNYEVRIGEKVVSRHALYQRAIASANRTAEDNPYQFVRVYLQGTNPPKPMYSAYREMRSTVEV